MGVSKLLEIIGQNQGLQTIWEEFRRRKRVQFISGLSGVPAYLWVAYLGMKGSWPVLVVTPGEKEAQEAATVLANFENRTFYFPPREVLPYEVYARSNEFLAQRLLVFEKLLCQEAKFVTLSGLTFAQFLLPPAVLAFAFRKLEKGQQINWEELQNHLRFLGYERTELVESPGQYSVRGSIIDVYPLTTSFPVRLELLGEEIISLRFFDTETQQTTSEITEPFLLSPARELLLSPEVRTEGRIALEKEYMFLRAKFEKQGEREALRNLTEKITPYLEKMLGGGSPEGLEQWQPFFYPVPFSLLDYFSVAPLVVWEEPVKLKETFERAVAEKANRYAELVAGGRALPTQAKDAFSSFAELREVCCRSPLLYFASLPRQLPELKPEVLVNAMAKTPPAFLGKAALLAEELRRWQQQRFTVIFFLGEASRAQSLKQGLKQYEIEATYVSDLEKIAPGQIFVTAGTFPRGSEFPLEKLVLLSGYEVYGQKQRLLPRRFFREGTKVTSLADLKPGDFVVHLHHGIGRYLGIEELEVQGAKRDYLLIAYAGEDKLYVPADQVGLIHKYIGEEEHVPKLSKLGGGDWARVKRRAQEAVQELAKELLSLYAVRETIPGYTFSPDTDWQREFEEAFPYQETPDQLQAIVEVKKDMTNPKPMDRLVCGDVGYGKTEVALRAAFKAVIDGKQVAVLVPTTVLAQQHYLTFSNRLASYPVRIAQLSRFSSPKEQEEMIAGLKMGSVDIVVGTHRLLSPDVGFKDLGLVIIDEEQRFGVTHKEKLKQLKKNTDVLTLTATPIPRTLHMSLMGLRDMSLIETPPENRYPVQTYVVEYNPELVRDAIRRELQRKGQVYYVHNRIADIDQVACFLQQLVPEARIAVGHGQLKEEQLEQVMLDFIAGRYDILVCTTIVENGLDIPNVNTLIVEDADSLGLAQLYQLRGRVGRSNRLAYAYFTYRRDKVISPVAEKRLAAIREFTEFGAGFKIAMRDLELRGAGNLLGPEQHGHMLAVGFELYCRLLQEAVQELKGEEKPLPPPPAVELRVDAYLTNAYLPSPTLKMELYQRLAHVQNLSEVRALAAEIRDRYGEPPPPVKRLLAISRLKILARETGVTAVHHEKGEIKVEFGPDAKIKGEKLLRLAQAFPGRLSFSSLGGLAMRIKGGGLAQEELLRLLEKVFWKLNVLTKERVKESKVELERGAMR